MIEIGVCRHFLHMPSTGVPHGENVAARARACVMGRGRTEVYTQRGTSDFSRSAVRHPFMSGG